MDVIIVCHTEFGYVKDKEVIFKKDYPIGVEQGVPNLINVADKYGAKLTFTVCPEVVKSFPKGIKHEIGLHIHPGWVYLKHENGSWIVGDRYLKEHCQQSVNSTVLWDYPYDEQLNMIRTGKEYLEKELDVEPRVFVAGRWCEDNNTIKALIEAGITHSCSAVPHSICDHYDWSKLPRICMPYHPSQEDYQKRGDLPLLIIPISQALLGVSANPEDAPNVGLPWLKACFSEYYRQDLPLFHICLHSPCGTDDYLTSVIDKLLGFISRHKKVNFKFASEVGEYEETNPKTDILPYIFGINRDIIRSYLKWGISLVKRA